jgi:hypothetical protein
MVYLKGFRYPLDVAHKLHHNSNNKGNKTMITLNNLSEHVTASSSEEAELQSLLGIGRDDCLLSAMLNVERIKELVLDDYAQTIQSCITKTQASIIALIERRLDDAHISEEYTDDINYHISSSFDRLRDNF